MSSPIAPPSFGEIFDNVQGTPHILSSPVHSAFPQFDPTSPFTSIRKTPNDRGLRRMRTEGFLISPMTSIRAQASMHPLHSGNTFINANGSRTPTLGFRPVSIAPTPVKIANTDSIPSWDGMDFSGLNADGIDMSAFDGITFGSPSKNPQPDNTATPILVAMPDPTPLQSPTAPRSAKKTRTLSGLGTPAGAHRPTKRIRQATYDANSMPVSPSASRRRTAEPSSSLTTSVPLSRAVSSSSIYLGATQPFQQDRNVSASSAMTASTSYEIMSPNLQAFPDIYPPVPASTSLPELMPSRSQMPSPSLPGGGSPICTPQQPAGLFYTSPEQDQGAFGPHDVQGEMTLMSQVAHVMPQSTSMMSVASFPSNQGYRQNTLTTIVETPMLAQEGMTFSAPSSSQLPNQPILPPQPQFQHMEYPAVPGISLNFQPGLPTATQPMDIQAWSAQTYSAQPQVFNFQSGPPPAPGPSMPHPPQRHASASFLNYQMRSNELPVFPAAPRSVSAPYVHTMANVPPPPPMPMAHSLSQGGLFGPLAAAGPSEPMSDHQQGWTHSAPVSPETPRKRQQYPPIGKRLKPGPKPKPKTPKKGKGSSSSPEEGINPMVFGGPSNALPMVEEASTIPREPSPKAPLVFGPDLSSVPLMQRTLSGTELGGNPLLQQQLPGQPQLVIQPPRSSFSGGSGPGANGDGANGGPAGLPRAFLEKLYTTFLTLDGSMTGQPVKRFKCLIEGCERHFPRKSAIHSHIQTHLEDKPYVCNTDDCHAAFVRQHDLRRHMRIHSGTKPFPCPCGKGFARGDALMRHRQRGICSGSLVPRRDDL
ncbi:uncharacterized protein I303_100907 [Kwoniella dejecticola CBS 10117]|uniref:C2H2-type domain-containing protein n=1 Tax=Kwoniella dejecticola CBS 10117 TaxID=1296121 RepID=A0A1A6AGA3_9TREE|nr:uncharacterized protein I303_00911 [Kwoniella dejecticola CBS 10117]OBR89089.1 hypothetical protein I303_00911 [Kwoniella dejecticola CBS 10117]